MDTTENQLKQKILQYINDIGGQNVEEIEDNQIDFHYVFNYYKFPINVRKEKGKKQILIIIAIALRPEIIDAITEMAEEKKPSFYFGLRNIFYLHEISYFYDFRKDINRHIEIKHKHFTEEDQFTLNDFFISIRKVYSCHLAVVEYINMNFDHNKFIDSRVENGSTLYS